MRVHLLVAAVLSCSTACAVPWRPARLPPASEGYVAVLSGEMPGAISQVARHSWIVANVPGDGMHRYELGPRGNEPFEYFGDGEIAIHGIVHYEGGELARIVACLDREKQEYRREHEAYFPIPGPNSNTIIDYLLRRCGIHVELPATAIGRDYRGVVGASVTSLGTGVQLETWLVGLKVGLQEGIELHLLDMPLGVHFWPPGITVPVNPGRIGIDDSLRGPSTQHVRYGASDEGDRDYGVASMWLGARYARVIDPQKAGGLSDMASATFEARAAYGRHVGYAFGLDLEAGAGFPPGFAYATRLYPVGVALMLNDDTMLGAYGGLGSEGVTARVPGAFELATELRLEVDVAPRARLGLRGAVDWFPAAGYRRGGSILSPFADALVLSAFARIGRAGSCRCGAHMGRGYFFALERHEVVQTAWLGLTFGVEADFGG